MIPGGPETEAAVSAAVEKLRERLPLNREIAALQWWHAEATAGLAKLDVDTLLLAAHHFGEQGAGDVVRKILPLLPESDATRMDRVWLERLASRPAREAEFPLLACVHHASEGDTDFLARVEHAAAWNESVAYRRGGDLRLARAVFADDAAGRRGWTTLPSLKRSSRDAVPAAKAARKPMVRDLFAAAARLAQDLGLPYFLVANSDNCFTDDLLAALKMGVEAGYRTFAVTRTNIPALGATDPAQWLMMQIGGADTLVCETRWWLEHEGMFEDYILGEPEWDTTYIGCMATRSPFYYFSHVRGLTLHVAHARRWSAETPLAQYNLQIAARRDHLFHLLHKAYYQSVQAFAARHRFLPTFRQNLDLLRVFRDLKISA